MATATHILTGVRYQINGGVTAECVTRFNIDGEQQYVTFSVEVPSQDTLGALWGDADVAAAASRLTGKTIVVG
jgi:hypothetical protein